MDRLVMETYAELERRATVTAFLATSAARFAESRIRSLAITRGCIESPLPRVLFVDDANAGLSQMAMGEVDIPLHHAFPKPLSDDVHEAAQIIITFDCADRLQRLPGKDYRDWDVPNLVGRPLEDIRRARENIEARVHELQRALGADAAEGAATPSWAAA